MAVPGWPEVCALEPDIKAIVAQAVARGTVRRDDAEDRVQDAMVEALQLAPLWWANRGTVEGTFAGYVTATLRRTLLHVQDRDSVDAMSVAAPLPTVQDGVQREFVAPSAMSADISANLRDAGKAAAGAVENSERLVSILQPIERRVASLLASGMSPGQIARKLGTTRRGILTIAGMATAKIRRMEKTQSLIESTN